MDKPRMLSGEAIVAKGITKIEATLPELGLKDVTPNGSWLEQKQIQAALEARKHLVEVERIEKRGALSHAEWRDDLMLAEVTQKVGGHWQHIGHNVGKTLYLKPEEALFLLEINCLLLTHNDITLSLQKAYSLLLREPVTITQYKVYASLSRLGYKVIRHREVKRCSGNIVECNTKVKEKESQSVNERDDDIGDKEAVVNNDEKKAIVEDKEAVGDDEEMKAVVDDNVVENSTQPSFDSGVHSMEDDTENSKNTFGIDINSNKDTKTNKRDTICSEEGNNSNALDTNHEDNQKQTNYVTKLDKLRQRRLKPTNSKTLHRHFECVPDLFQKQIITINVPQQDHLPKNVFVNKSSYMLNLENIKVKRVRPASTESATYSICDEVNGQHVRRIRNISSTDISQNVNPFPNMRFPRQLFNYRPFNFWRPQTNFNNFQFGMFFQRPCYQNMFFVPRLHFNPRPHPYVRQLPNERNVNFGNARKRTRHIKTSQLQAIKTLAARLKQLIMSGNSQLLNIQGLHRLLHTYNNKYKCRLRLTDNFDVVNDETIIETIELDDEEESKSKRPRLEEEDDMRKENLDALRQLALKLKELESKNKATARQRRAFSNAIKTYNKSYDSDVYLSSDYEILDRRHITLDSSCESDCVVEAPKSPKRKKLLRNPFNIMKRLSEKMNASNLPTTSESEDQRDVESAEKVLEYKEHTRNTFNENWLPPESDFGRAEIIPKLSHTTFLDNYKEEYLLDFMNNQHKKYNSWLEAKISCLKHVEVMNIALQQSQLEHDVQETSYTGLRPLISKEDCVDMPTVLEKLRIIKNNKDFNTESKLKIDFDVYNRDVQNFKKTNPPKPHFRLICVQESSIFPAAAEIEALHAKYDDNVPIVFAISGNSVGYLQVTSLDLPIYIPNSDLDLSI